MSVVKKRAIRTSMNFMLLYKDMETVHGISSTVQDMALSPRQIVSNYSRGLPVPFLQPVYDEELMHKIQGMDLVDIYDFKDATNQRVIDLRDKLQNEQREEFKKQREAEYEDEVSKRIKARDDEASKAKA